MSLHVNLPERHLRTADQASSGANKIIAAFLLEHSAIYRGLSELREKGWNNPKGDEHFRKQRKAADNADRKQAQRFYHLMQGIGKELHSETQAFTIAHKGSDPIHILDMCMAPGGFLKTALDMNPGSRAVAFSLPVAEGGHEVFLRGGHVDTKFCDVTMLAADMGIEHFSEATIDADRLVSHRLLPPETRFDLAICDGQVLRKEKHQRAPYREQCESTRLLSTQLALSLEHLQSDGTMIILLHRLDAHNTITLLRDFYTFSKVVLHKPKVAHGMRSSFYMVASKVKCQSQEALQAVCKWKEAWRRATFQEKQQENDGQELEDTVKALMEQFGPTLIQMGEKVWDGQARALGKASFMRKK